jgi:MFS family permease
LTSADTSAGAGWTFPAISRAAAWFHPRSQPLLARRNYSLELTATLFFALALAAIESGVVAVFAKQTFEGHVSDRALHLGVAVLGTMDALANILSFIWTGATHGRPKVRAINALQLGTLAAVLSLAFLPRTPAGLLMLVAAVLIARTCWSGVVTLRPTVWRANYPTGLRASIVGRVATVQVLVIALVGAVLGGLLDASVAWFRWAIPVVVALALVAVVLTSRQRVRRERQLLRRELAATPVLPPWKGPLVVWDVLRADPWYTRFMAWMFVLGFGNLMAAPMLAITLRDRFGLGYLASILVTSTIPFVVQSLALPAWGRLLDRAHIVRFRSIHAWFFVAAGAILLAASLWELKPLVYASAVVLGVAYAGGTLAWNLGHVDFSPPSQTGRYMATHVTLNGVRGLLAPLAAVAIYEWARAQGWNASAWVFAVSLALTVVGAMGFVSLRREMTGASLPMRKRPGA